jgi:hypothetical protein
MYLFRLKNGKRKLAYGESPADALEILSVRLTQQEMAQIIQEDYVRIHQRDLHKYVDQLG